MFRDEFSPLLVLALFSRWLAEPQLDWPSQTLQPGFVYFEDTSFIGNLPPELSSFLASGTAPIVFTQGSTAIHNPGDFYSASAAAAKRRGHRAVLLGAPPKLNQDTVDLTSTPYVPYSQVFPHAAVLVHQGGSGTTGEALRAGKPMLVVPYGWDQPDNAARVTRLGVGLPIAHGDYTVNTATVALQRLLEDERFAARTAQVGPQVAAENALTVACDAIERCCSLT